MFKKNTAKAALGALLATLIVGLAACGGNSGPSDGGSNPQPPTTTGVAVPTYITDDMSAEFSKVWVGVRSIAIVDGSGVSQTLYTPDAGTTSTQVNLSDLSNVGSLLASATVPPGTYTKAVVVLDNDVTLEPVEGSAPIKATFGSTGAAVTIEVPISLTANSTTPLLIDFDLARWTYDVATNVVKPWLEQRTEQDILKFERTKIEINGKVTATGGSNGTRLTVTSPRFPNGVAVQYDDRFTTIFSGKDGSAASIDVGARVEVHGNVHVESDGPVVYAVAIKVKTENETDADSAKVGKLDGSVVSYAAPKLQIAVRDANFRPDAKTVSVDLTNAVFVRGSASDLLAGAEVRIRGQRASDGSFVATFVDVKGGSTAKEKARGEIKARFAAIGQVTALDKGVATLKVVKMVGANVSVAPGTTVEIDLAAVSYASGDQSCLLNSTINVEGVIEGSGYKAREVAARGGCAVKVGDDGVRKITQLTGQARVEGVLKSFDESIGTYTLEIFEVHGFLPPSRTVVVLVTKATKIDDTAGKPAVGDVVEAVGTWNGATSFFTAVKLEKDE